MVIDHVGTICRIPYHQSCISFGDPFCNGQLLALYNQTEQPKLTGRNIGINLDSMRLGIVGGNPVDIHVGERHRLPYIVIRLYTP